MRCAHFYKLSGLLMATIVVGSYQSLAFQKQPEATEMSNQDQHPAPEPYSFSYSAESNGGMSTHEERGDGSGKVTGFYTIMGDDGRVRRVDYVADENGYRATIKTNEVGTRSESSADAQYEAQLPSPKQLEAAKVTAEQYQYLEKTHQTERERHRGHQGQQSQRPQWQAQSGNNQMLVSTSEQQPQLSSPAATESSISNQDVSLISSSQTDSNSNPDDGWRSRARLIKLTQRDVGPNYQTVTQSVNQQQQQPQQPQQQQPQAQQLAYNRETRYSQEPQQQQQQQQTSIPWQQQQRTSNNNQQPIQRKRTTVLQRQLEAQFMQQASQLTEQDYPRQQTQYKIDEITAIDDAQPFIKDVSNNQLGQQQTEVAQQQQPQQVKSAQQTGGNLQSLLPIVANDGANDIVQQQPQQQQPQRPSVSFQQDFGQQAQGAGSLTVEPQQQVNQMNQQSAQPAFQQTPYQQQQQQYQNQDQQTDIIGELTNEQLNEQPQQQATLANGDQQMASRQPNNVQPEITPPQQRPQLIGNVTPSATSSPLFATIASTTTTTTTTTNTPIGSEELNLSQTGKGEANQADEQEVDMRTDRPQSLLPGIGSITPIQQPQQVQTSNSMYQAVGEQQQRQTDIFRRPNSVNQIIEFQREQQKSAPFQGTKNARPAPQQQPTTTTTTTTTTSTTTQAPSTSAPEVEQPVVVEITTTTTSAPTTTTEQPEVPINTSPPMVVVERQPEVASTPRSVPPTTTGSPPAKKPIPVTTQPSAPVTSGYMQPVEQPRPQRPQYGVKGGKVSVNSGISPIKRLRTNATVNNNNIDYATRMAILNQSTNMVDQQRTSNRINYKAMEQTKLRQPEQQPTQAPISTQNNNLTDTSGDITRQPQEVRVINSTSSLNNNKQSSTSSRMTDNGSFGQKQNIVSNYKQPMAQRQPDIMIAGNQVTSSQQQQQQQQQQPQQKQPQAMQNVRKGTKGGAKNVNKRQFWQQQQQQQQVYGNPATVRYNSNNNNNSSPKASQLNGRGGGVDYVNSNTFSGFGNRVVSSSS